MEWKCFHFFVRTLESLPRVWFTNENHLVCKSEMRLKQSPPRWMASRPVRTLTISSRCISTGHLKYCYFPSKPNQSNNVHRFLNSADFGIANDRKHHWCCQDLESKFHPDHIPETLFFFSATKPMKPKTYQSTKCAKDRSARVHVVFSAMCAGRSVAWHLQWFRAQSSWEHAAWFCPKMEATHKMAELKHDFANKTETEPRTNPALPHPR